MLVQSFQNGNKEKLQMMDFGRFIECMHGYKVPYIHQESGIYGIDAAYGQWNAPARNHGSCLAIVFRRCASTRNIVFRLNFKFLFSLCGFFVAISRHVSPCGASAFAPEALEALGDVSAKLFHPTLTLSRALACSTRSTQFHVKTKEFAKGVTKMVFKNFILHLLRNLLCAV